MDLPPLCVDPSAINGFLHRFHSPALNMTPTDVHSISGKPNAAEIAESCMGTRMMNVMLKSLLGLFVKKGTLTLQLPDGQHLTVGEAKGQALSVRLMDRRALRQLIFNPELALGELYTDGRLTVSGGSIYDLLSVLAGNFSHMAPNAIARLRRAVRSMAGLWRPRNTERLARSNVHRHYDIDDRIYSLFLDSDRQYSCAYFETQDQTLEEAQLAKKRHITAKLRLFSGASVLDVGSGWGGLALYLAELEQADVTGLTLSSEQLKISDHRARDRGLGSRVRFRLQDYRALQDTFDRIVSVGMFEHVGKWYYPTFFNAMTRSLKTDGIGLLHFIGRLDGKSPMNPWFVKYIFPGSYLPALSEVLPVIEASGLIVTDVEILRLHYADTLAAWRRRFLARRQQAASVLGDRFCRMWEFYLAAAEIGFRYQGLAVFQIQFAKQIESVPRTRAYIEKEETRLRQLENAPLCRPSNATRTDCPSSRPSGQLSI